MRTTSLKLSKKLFALSFVALFALPVLAQRHAMNDYYGDTTRGNKTTPKRDITFGFLSPINQHLSFAYEQAVNYQSLFCVRVGVIGPGFSITSAGASSMYQSNAPTAAGGYLSVGAKLFVHPDFALQGMTRYNDMQGFYFNPELIVGNFEYTYTWSYYTYYPYQSYTITSTDNVTNYAVILNLGKQWVFANRFVLNIHAGIGYGGAKVSGTQPPYGFGNVLEMVAGNYYDYICPGVIAYSGGVDIGVLF